jgi:hypothetical protein
MSGITDSIGEGWDERKITKKNNERNNFVNEQHGGRDDSILSAKIIRIAPESSSF